MSYHSETLELPNRTILDQVSIQKFSIKTEFYLVRYDSKVSLYIDSLFLNLIIFERNNFSLL